MRERLSVPEAAKLLGISEGALRQRLHRGSIESEKDEDGRVYVVITRDNERENERDNTHDANGESPDTGEITQLLRQQNEFLRREVEAWQEEARRKDHIIAGLVQRVPELEHPTEPREAPVTASEEPFNTHHAPQESQEPSQSRSWLHRFFFGPG